MFVILAVVILGSAIMCVFTKRIMRAATFLLFVREPRCHARVSRDPDGFLSNVSSLRNFRLGSFLTV